MEENFHCANLRHALGQRDRPAGVPLHYFTSHAISEASIKVLVMGRGCRGVAVFGGVGSGHQGRRMVAACHD